MITDKNQLVRIEILEHFEIQVRVDRIILDNDGVTEISRVPHRTTVVPGDDVSNLPNPIQRIAGILWTPQVIADYQAFKAQQIAKVPKGSF